jgi:prepilin-type N-terminal cleavage/methylation domain-containing protein
MKLSGRNHKGFTLIETIIAIVAAAILGVMAFTYSQTALTKSAQPLNQSQKAMELQKVMENILVDYNLDKTNLVVLKTKIANPTSQQPPPAGYGPYTLVDNKFVKLVGSSFVDIDPVNDPPEIQNQVLLVTIKNDLGETLSILLTRIVT